MVTVNSRLAGPALGFAITAVASPSFAQKSENHNSAAARAAAIHECSVLASRYVEHTWGDTEIDQYRACMAAHGQKE
jgi:hypothetical protein